MQEDGETQRVSENAEAATAATAALVNGNLTESPSMAAVNSTVNSTDIRTVLAHMGSDVPENLPDFGNVTFEYSGVVDNPSPPRERALPSTGPEEVPASSGQRIGATEGEGRSCPSAPDLSELDPFGRGSENAQSGYMPLAPWQYWSQLSSAKRALSDRDAAANSRTASSVPGFLPPQFSGMSSVSPMVSSEYFANPTGDTDELHHGRPVKGVAANPPLHRRAAAALDRLNFGSSAGVPAAMVGVYDGVEFVRPTPSGVTSLSESVMLLKEDSVSVLLDESQLSLPPAASHGKEENAWGAKRGGWVGSSREDSVSVQLEDEQSRGDGLPLGNSNGPSNDADLDAVASMTGAGRRTGGDEGDGLEIAKGSVLTASEHIAVKLMAQQLAVGTPTGRAPETEALYRQGTGPEL
jgi:hypothetical protein